ncbi:cache domain-containing protein [Candidatus Symbiobacter mobilis]|uniref:Serine phosphatase RsbU n=1 Tax=Candidatus Symbiobacter mobilis CR TaxID=946483 RepID=U5NCM7_9BURK|nr:cache domain-containing protein [Candidatus Symbiobacter mobilis]AGX87904.1 serine phosphatase RsbU [Candidatus Symbiobacter mobilis CR]
MKKSIKTKYLLTGLVICLVSLILVSVASYYVAYSITREQTNAWVEASAMKNAVGLDWRFRKYGQILEDMASEIANHDGELQDRWLLNIIVKKNAQYSSESPTFYIVLQDNKLFYPDQNWKPLPGFDFRTRGWYLSAIKSEIPVYSTPYVDAFTGKMIITISKKLQRNGELIGVIAVDFQITDVLEIVKNYNVGESSYAFLLDQEGQFLTHPNTNFLPDQKTSLKNIYSVNIKGYSHLQARLKRGKTDIIKIVDYDNQIRYFTTAMIESNQWVLGVAIPESMYRKPLNRLFSGYIAALLLALVIGFGIMYKLVIGMTKPIKSLNDGVKSFSVENMSARVAVHSDDEIGELGKSFNQMADTIQEYSQSLEKKVADRTRELQEKNQNIMESIHYAERLQRAILPPLPHRLGIADDKCFVIWKPKDTVGGDMYWCRGDDRYVLVAVADCTGHGVPGALMTMALGSILDSLPRSLEGTKPSALLHRINLSLRETLRQENQNSLANDGADVALCLLDKQEKTFLYAGAKLSAFVEKNGQITEYKGTKHSVGYSHGREVIFEDREIKWIDGSVVYLTTDGLLDQNSVEGKGGMGRSGFIKLLQSLAGQPFAVQEQTVEQLITTSLAQVQQRDDITVVGFEMGGSLKGRIGP